MKNRIRFAVITTGFSGIVAQLLLLRELLIVFAGNELSIGIVLANWLIIEAFGCFVLGKRAEKIKNRIIAYVIITILFSLSLPAMLYLTRILRNLLDLSVGEGIGIVPVLYSSFFILLPVSLFHGALFTFGCRVYAAHTDKNAVSIGKVYVLEILGTIVGGLVWTYLLIPWFHSFLTALGVALLNLLVCCFLILPLWKKTQTVKVFAVFSVLLTLAASAFLFSGRADRLHYASIKTQWRGQNIVHYQNSIYGNVSVMEIDDQYTFFLDGIPHIITPIPDIVSVEEFVHLPLLSHPNPEKVLILSGGAGGVISSVLKHPSVKRIDYAELDPLVLELVRKFPTTLTEDELTDDRVAVRHIDGRLFLKQTENKYDVVFVGLREPSDLQSNRFFTKEFFSLTEKKLKEPGMIVTGLPGSLTYLNEELRDLNSSLFHTMESVFPYVRVIPGDGTNLFLAANSPDITLVEKEELINRLYLRDLTADVIIPWNIEYKLNPRWVDWFMDFIEDSSQKINHDFKPIALYYSISHWNALFTPSLRGFFRGIERINRYVLLFPLVFFFALFLILRTKKSDPFRTGIIFCIGTTGFAGMMFDLLLIFTFQALYGYVFAWIGLLVTAFMAGSATGATLMTSFIQRVEKYDKMFVKTELLILSFTIILPLLFLSVQPFLDRPAVFDSVKFLFLPLSVLSGVLVGIQFPLANRIYLQQENNYSKTAGLFYGSDLLGGWFGGILGSVILLPVLGLLEACLMLFLLKLGSFLLLTIPPGKH